MEGKPLLRKRLLEQRARRSEAARASAARALAELAVRSWGSCQRVAAYASVGPEPPTQLLLDALSGNGAELLLPVVDGLDLDWARYDGWDALVPGPRGLLQPAGPPLGAAALSTVELVAVPALAVDRRGGRLGRGGGYYDRTLAAIHGIPTAAVIYDDELVDELPTEDHDVAVEAALTPGGLVQLPA